MHVRANKKYILYIWLKKKKFGQRESDFTKGGGNNKSVPRRREITHYWRDSYMLVGNFVWNLQGHPQRPSSLSVTKKQENKIEFCFEFFFVQWNQEKKNEEKRKKRLRAIQRARIHTHTHTCGVHERGLTGESRECLTDTRSRREEKKKRGVQMKYRGWAMLAQHLLQE